MAIISITDKFLGSLVGTYIGSYYSEQLHGQWPPVSSSLLYQSWLSHIQQDTILSPNPADVSLIWTLPWLLHHHDDRSSRYHWLIKVLASSTQKSAIIDDGEMANTAGAVYILGDCLEWLMQSSLAHQHPRSLLCKYLQQKCSTYPSTLNLQINRFIEALDAMPPSAIPQIMGHNHPWLTITSALKCCMDYPENMALALSSQGIEVPVASLVGCLLGAWRGPSVIPMAWRMALTQDSSKSLGDMAQQLYRRWAGSDNMTANFEAFPLDF